MDSYINRKDAGEIPANALNEHRGEEDIVVLGLPHGAQLIAAD